MGKKRIEAKEIRQQNIVDMLKKYDQEVHPAGEPCQIVFVSFVLKLYQLL